MSECLDCKDLSPYERSLAHFDLRDEIKKLGLILQAVDDSIVNRNHVLEKLATILAGKPNGLSPEIARQFNRWKKGPEYLQ